MLNADPNKEGSPLADFFQVLRLRKTLILLILALVVITTAIVTAFLPKWYRSTVSVRTLKLDATGTIFQTQSANYYDPYFVQDQLRTIQSPKIIYPVIAHLGLNQKLSNLDETGVALPTDYTYEYITRKMLRVESPRNTSLIEISVDSRDPALAAEIANEIVRVYTADRIDFATSAQRADLIELNKQVNEQEKIVSQLRDGVERLRAELNLAGIDFADTRTSDMEVDRLRQMQNTLVALNVDAIGTKTRYEQFKAIPVEERITLVNSQLINDPNIQQLQQAYLVAEQNVTKLRARLGEAHPELIVAVENRAKIRSQLEAQLMGYERALEMSWKEAEARVNELKSQLEKAQIAQIASASERKRPFEEAVQKHEEAKRLLTTLKLTLRQREIDFQVPKRPVEVLNTAEPARRPAHPNWPINLTLAFLIGAVLGIGTAVLIDMLDASFRSVADVERRLQRPVLGVIPASLSARKPAEEPIDPAESEPFRVLQTNITLTQRGESQTGARIFALLSAGPGEGKSTTVLRLARAMGAAGERVLLIDADLRRPVQHTMLSLAKAPGLADLLKSKATIEQTTCRQIAPGLDFIPCGNTSGFTLSLFYADRLKEILAELRGRYDRIIFDAPPVIGVSDTSVVMSLVDHVLLLIQYRRNPLSMVVRAQQIIASVHKEVLGVVLNRVPKNAGSDYAYYNKNYSYYSGGGSGRRRSSTGNGAKQGQDKIDFSEKKP